MDMTMKRESVYVWVRPKGTLYAFNTYCHTLKEAMATYPTIGRRSYIAEWWTNPVSYRL